MKRFENGGGGNTWIRSHKYIEANEGSLTQKKQTNKQKTSRAKNEREGLKLGEGISEEENYRVQDVEEWEKLLLRTPLIVC